MIKRTLLVALLATAFTIHVGAVDIQVPEGQPPVPGADAKIPTNAYETYRAVTTNNESFLIKSIRDLNVTVDKRVESGEISVEHGAKLKARLDESMRLAIDTVQVVNIYNDSANIKLTAPIHSVVGGINTNKKETYYLVAERNVYLGIGIQDVKNKKEDTFKSIEDKGEFIYPGLYNTKWGLSKQEGNENEPLLGTEFQIEGQPNSMYFVGLAYANKPITTQVSRIMANYIIPSIQPVDTVKAYANSITWDNITYHVPTTAQLVKEKTDDNNREWRLYDSKGVKLYIERKPAKQKNSNVYTVDAGLKAAQTDLLRLANVPYQNAIVWNNGVPSYFIEQYQTGKPSIMRHYLHDEQYDYTVILTYVDGHSPYSHIQLRNMIEWIYFKNARKLGTQVYTLDPKQ